MSRAAHDTFTIERSYDATPARVFAAWARPEARARWFVGPAGWTALERSLDFRVGGKEVTKGRFSESGVVSNFESLFLDIVPDQRIIFTYVMHVNDRKISASLATLELEVEGEGTRLRYTEQGAFIDGYEDNGGRKRGTEALLNQLDAWLRSQ
jgi:uncharacterized protein YndB with AHSA1/START domain